MERREKILRHVQQDSAGIEIGPSFNPVAPRKLGFKVEIIDHASREDLVKKYTGHGVPLDNIEEVDHVWSGERFADLTGRPNHYQWVIASHVIEHTPDLVGFLQDCDGILRDDGVLSLVIPDKRFCFDRFRPVTGLARIIDSHLSGHRIHSVGTVSEYCLNVVARAGRIAWDGAEKGPFALVHAPDYARMRVEQVRAGTFYDAHAWCFVPHSFRLILHDLHLLGYTTLREVEFHATEGGEFFMTLGRGGAGPGLPRLEMLQLADAEARDVS